MESARQTRGEFKPHSGLIWIGHRNAQVLHGTWRISQARRKVDDHAASGSGGTTMTATTGAGVGAQRYRVLGCKPRNRKCRANFQLGAEKHKNDEYTGEQKKHSCTESFHLNYPLGQFLIWQRADLNGLSLFSRAIRAHSPDSQTQATT